MEITLEQQIMNKNINTKHQIASSKQKFESDDSEGSGYSYQSSLTDQDDNNLGRIQFFKQQMARFFINYPELINKNIIEDQSEKDISSEGEIGEKQNKNMNRNWQYIADQIFNQAKESSTSLQSLAKRIALYRYKVDQTDLIDLLLQQKDTILREIQAEIHNKKNNNTQMGRTEKLQSNLQKKMKQDNSYLSWRKRKQFEFKLQTNRNNIQKSDSVTVHKQADSSLQKQKSKPVQKFHRSLHKSSSMSCEAFGKSIKNTKIEVNKIKSKPKEKQFKQQKENLNHLQDSQTAHQYGSRLAANWRHLINFQPKTEVAKQLCEEIKKKNQPSDQLGIKKTIIEYLHNYKMLINNDVISKSTLSQKIQKLYSEQAKELLMFYPSKLSTYDSQNLNSCNNLKEGGQDNFMNLLKKISDGPLIKYWKQIQQSKI